MKRNEVKKLWRVLSSGLVAGWLSLATQAATHNVQIVDFSFSPANVTAQVGDTVRWVQVDDIQHTTTHNGSPRLWDSDPLDVGETFSHTFAAAGTYNYFCRPHSDMTGRITVQQATVTPPTVSVTAPANNTVFPRPGDVELEATASIPGPATISSVEFFSNGTSLGTVNASPYKLTHNFAAAGSYSITAKATTSEGASATSTPVSITVSTPRAAVADPYPVRMAKGDTTIELETVAENLVAPLGMAAPADGRLFIYDQTGTIHILKDGALLPELLLDMRSRLVTLNANYDERGLLGLALHPDFAQNGLLYTYSSEPAGSETADFPLLSGTNNHHTVLAEWKIDVGNSNRVDTASRRQLMRIAQPQSNHNGGVMHFGPNGLLYLALGDGGAADDQGNGHSPAGNGQDLNTILGKIIRIDVNARTSSNGQYGVPGDNPFAGATPGLDEIYAYGFRNPFSWSFDKLTGEMYVADVGQNKIEELDRVFKGGNYGWPLKEGTYYFDNNGGGQGYITTEPPPGGVPNDIIDPIAEYDHEEGTAVIGGYIYRGSAIPGLINRYVCADWGFFSQPSSGRLFYLDRDTFKELRLGLDNRGLGLWVKGVGQDQQGELYVLGSTTLGPSGTTGKVLKIVPVGTSIEITGATNEGANLTLTWTGGVGPFLVQAKGSLDDNLWRTVSAAPGNSVTIAMDAQSSFFRIADMAGNGAIPFTAHLSGAAERPTPNNSTASGSATLSLEGNTLHFDIHYTGLTGAATMAHIHGPASASEFATVLIDLAEFNGGAFGTSGRFAGSKTLTPAEKAHILSGRTYINIHTGEFGGGEIRGQINPVLFRAELSGAAERPTPVDTPAGGTGIFMLVGTNLTFVIEYADLKSAASMAHIHGPAGLNEFATVMVDLASFNNGSFAQSGTFSGTVGLKPDQFAALVDGRTYVNIHTPDHGSGEIRGQILPQTGALPLSAALTGAAERPNPVETPAQGLGLFALEGNTLHFNIRYADLKSAASMAHIHGPATAAAATGFFVDLAPFNGGAYGRSGMISGSVELTDLQRSWVLQGLTYVNIHTPDHGSGEIRGQIAPAAMHSVLLGASERNTSVHKPGKGRGSFVLIGKQLSFNLSYSGLSAVANNAHIHGPAPTSGFATVMEDLRPHNAGGFGAAGSFAGTFELLPAELTALIDQFTYVNIHTPTHGSGEIRGQIIR